MSNELIVTAAVLIVVLGIQETSANEYWNCTMDEGVPHFRLSMLCGKKVYASFMSGTQGDYSCVVAQFNCFSDGTVTCDSIVFQGGEKISRTSRLTDLQNGVVLRERLTETGDVVVRMHDIVTSFTVFASGDIKVGYYICGHHSKNDNPFMRAIITTYKDADLTQEVKVINKLIPWWTVLNPQ